LESSKRKKAEKAMTAYIEEKLEEIESRAENLYNRQASTGLGLEQDYSWLLEAVTAVRDQIRILDKHNELLFRIVDVMEKGGKPGGAVRAIADILKSVHPR
jgi:hypothetical protein